MATKENIYNTALVEHLKQRKLSSVTEDTPSRHTLDLIWDNGFIRSCLEEGYWNFAIKTIKITYSPSIDPDFGFQYGFDIPTDMVRPVGIASDEYFNSPLSQHLLVEEAGYWWSDYQEIYVRYVSDDSAYGGDMAKWPESFTRFVEVRLAKRGCKGVTKSSSLKKDLEKDDKAARKHARNKDALREGVKFPPLSSWNSSRFRWNRENNSRLRIS